MSTTVDKKTFHEQCFLMASTTYICSKMFFGVTFEYEFSDFIGTSYIKKHHVGDIKSILFGVPLFSRILFF